MKNVFVIIFCLMASMAFGQIKGLNALKTPEQKEAQAAQEKAQKAREAELDAYFGGRTTSPGPEVASDKQNIQAKKETFASKLERYKAEGFKVAVVVSSPAIKTTAPTADEKKPEELGYMGHTITLSGSLPSIKSDLSPLVEGYVSSMNEAFSTDLFEIVDISTIPYNDGKWGKSDDWSSTKYKMVVTFLANASYSYRFSSSVDDEYIGSLTVHLSATAAEYVYDKKKGFKIKYIVRTGGLGYYQSTEWKSESDPGLKTIEELQQVVNPPMGADLLVELQKEQDSKMDAYIEKRKK